MHQFKSGPESVSCESLKRVKYFLSSCVKGAQPNVGDRVLVEASYNANMPFRWNATRIQLLPNQVGFVGIKFVFVGIKLN